MVSSRPCRARLQMLAVYVCVANAFAIHLQIAKISESVFLDCCCGEGVNNFWKFKKVFIYFNKDQVDRRLGNDFSLSANYSLFIPSISLDHEGIYKCGQNKSTSYEHSVTVEVPPHLFTVVNGIKGANKVIIEENQELIAVCYASQAKPVVNLTWLLNDRIIDSSEVNFTLYPNANESKTFDSRAEFRNSLLKREGNISCVSSSQTLTKGQRVDVQYLQYALPTVLVTINGGNSTSGGFAVPRNKEIVVTCKVYGAYPKVKITWQIDNVTVNPEEGSLNLAVRTAQHNQTYNSISTLRYMPMRINGSITCISKLEKVDITQNCSVTFYTKAPPTLMISINGYHSKNVISLTSHEVIAYCDVGGAGSEFNLTWMIDNKQITTYDKHVNFTTTKIGIGMGHSFRAILRFHPKNEKGNLTCTVNGPTIDEVHAHAVYQIEETSGANEELWKSVYLYIAIAITLFFLLSGTVVLLLKKCSSSKHSSRKAQQQSQLYERSVARPDQHVISEQMQPEGKCFQDVALPPLELPSIVNPCDKYSTMKNDQDCYSMIKPNASHRGMFNESDLCLVFSMKTGRLYNRWMGTISQSNGEKTNVVASSAADATLRQSHIQWDAFVKRMLEIPDNENLVKVHGICVGGSSLYLMHEHLTCQTLESRLNCNRAVNKNYLRSMDASEVMKHTLGILEGVELIHSYGLLHPGLLTKKILLSQKGICKLYDFCLTEDASRVIAIKKSLTPSAHTFAPESILRSEYFQASDVWSVAIVIWQLFSGGDLPHFIQNGIENNLYNTWPERYQELRNNYLFECWKADFSSRPTIRQLRLSFLE